MLGERQVDEVGLPVGRLAVLDRLRDADDLDRRAVAALEPDPLAHRVGARPVVLSRSCSLTTATRGASAVSDARKPRPRRIGIPIVSKNPSSTVSIAEREALAIARHLEALRHEGDGLEVVQPERRVLREAGAPHSGRLPRTLRRAARRSAAVCAASYCTSRGSNRAISR